ncbi:isoleucine--tRNA ligase [Candidatus Saccharibacteria bacterium]|nr:isoleucine--tRNA ligase [Candidatus Saccharibacteria bacterium]
MKYQPRKRAIEYEKALVEWWKKNKIFEKSVNARDVDNSYVFYDGPPFITGMPHHGTLLSSIVKDAVPRFWTMRGKRVERRWGWDCHGLPAENFVEKQLGITDRRQIGGTGENAISLENYIIKARESMVANSETWESTIERIGRWVDFKGAYRTMDKDFMESVWWAFKTLYEAGKIYEGRKVLMYDTKFATPVSKAEVTMDNDAYQEVTDPSAFVKFRLVADCDTLLSSSPARQKMSHAGKRQEYTFSDSQVEKEQSLEKQSIEQSASIFMLAWTTTPWTLMANRMLAVKADAEYGLYEIDSTQLILMTKRAEVIFPEEKPTKTFKGAELVGMEYESIDGTKCKVFAGDFVGDEEGTGIVHIAPAYGEDDYALYLQHEDEAEFVDVLDENGYYVEPWAGKLHELGMRDTDENGIQIWDGNKFIAKVLEAAGIIYKIEYIKHEYPFNPRSKQRIMYRAFPSWFFNVTDQKEMMLEENENINWFPGYLKHGRFAKNIEQAPDWNLSRDRFWATAMPVWKGDKGSVKVVGSYDELYELSGVRLEDYHRPWVDEIEFDIDGEHFKRVDKVLDCWFESGSMPFAQLHYPFENKEKFEKNYPADFIVEYVGQVRAWFYYVHTVNTALASIGAFGPRAQKGAKNAYKNVITTGTLAGNDGRKMSKSLGNYTDPNELMDKYSADSLRFLLLSSPVLAGEDFALLDKDVSDVARKLSMIWNVYDFFATYANVDNFEGDGKLPENMKNSLDIWIVSRLHMLRDEIVEGMEEYNLPKATAGILPFVDDLSNWFVRRSRRRFWKSEDSADKAEAYATLYYVLLTLSKIIAPFVPFLSEELYHNLTQNTGESDSVHLLDFPGEGEVNLPVIEQMARTREIISEGLAQRMNRSDVEEQIKVRQPLGLFTYSGDKLPEEYEQMIADEVNVKKVEHGNATKLDKALTDELRAEGFARELIRMVQSARKKAGLSVDDRIKLYVECTLEPEYTEMVKTEVLATEFSSADNKKNYAYDEIVKVEGREITISLEKA